MTMQLKTTQQQQQSAASDNLCETCPRCHLPAGKDDPFKNAFETSHSQLQSSATTSNATNKLSKTNESTNSLLHRAARRIPCLGIILSLMSSLTLGSAGMIVKLTTSVPGVEVAAFRALIQLAVYTLLIIVNGLSFLPARGERLAVGGRAFFGGVSITASYFALKLIPLGDATTIRFSLPIWTLIISYLFLGESCSLLKIGAVASSILGVLLIAKPETCAMLLARAHGYAENSTEFHDFQQSASMSLNEDLSTAPPNQTTSSSSSGGDSSLQVSQASLLADSTTRQLIGSLSALCSSICLALSFVSLRMCRKTRAEIVVFWLSVMSLVTGLLFLMACNEFSIPDNWLDVVYMSLNGLLGAVGQWCITSALKVEQSGVISLARTFDIVVAFGYSVVLLHEPVTTFSLSGALLVCTGVLAVVIPKWLCVPSSSQDDDGGANGRDVEDNSNAADNKVNTDQRHNLSSTKKHSFVEVQLSNSTFQTTTTKA